LLENEPIVTLCRNVKNKILEVTDSYVLLLSEKSRKKLPRKILKDDIGLAHRKLTRGEIYTLKDINEIRGRRAIECAILAPHRNVSGTCENGKVLLKLMS